jgi:hypothetical protein
MSHSIKLWQCPSCRRVLLERSEGYARERHQALVAAAAGSTAEFVREATWPAYLASLRRCCCGSKKRLQAVDGMAPVGQLRLQLDGVVVP